MAEIAGLALSIIAVVGVFNDCVDILSRISAARSMGTDSERLNTKVDIERALLLEWADRVRLATPNHDPRLDNDTIGNAVLGALRSILGLFSDASNLRARYGLREADHGAVEQNLFSLSEKRMSSFREKFQALSVSSSGQCRQPSILKRGRWAIHDKEKFETLVAEITYFTSAINRLIPDIDNSALKLLKEDFRLLKRVSQSRLVLDALPYHKPVLEDVAMRRHSEICAQRILDTIWFRSMNERRDEVTNPCSGTYEWPFGSSGNHGAWSNLHEWLEQGSGIYWICGKPAAGKSTLMRHLLNHKKTMTSLEKWSSGSELRVRSFFFRYAGIQEQRSHAGLVRALLHGILKSGNDPLKADNAVVKLDNKPVKPDAALVKEALPNMWREAFDLGLDELSLPSSVEIRQAFAVLGSQACKAKFCIFIDGLDEYDGDYMDGIALLQRLAANCNVKIIVSSRPIPQCYEAFHRNPMLKLENLNRQDITIYVNKVMGGNEHMESLLMTHPDQAQCIMQSLVSKAEGVFLWVVLACRSLLAGLGSGDYIRELERRLDALPKELEDLFGHILERIPRDYKIQAVRLLKVAHQAQRIQEKDGCLVTLALALMAECDLDLSHITFPPSLTIECKREKCIQLERRLRSRSLGLLEVVETYQHPGSNCVCGSSSGHDAFVDSRVRFLHKTLFEYFETTNNEHWTSIAAESGQSVFDARSAVAWHALNMVWISHDGKNLDSWSDRNAWTKTLIQLVGQLPGSNITATHMLLRKVVDVARMLSLDTDDARPIWRSIEAYPPEDVVLILAVQFGMMDFCITFQEQLRSWVSTSKHPLLYYAMLRPEVAQHYVAETVPLEMIRFFLSMGCDPNQEALPDCDAQSLGLASAWSKYCVDHSSALRSNERDAKRYCESIRLLGAAGARLTTSSTELARELDAWPHTLLSEHTCPSVRGAAKALRDSSDPAVELEMNPSMAVQRQIVSERIRRHWKGGRRVRYRSRRLPESARRPSSALEFLLREYEDEASVIRRLKS